MTARFGILLPATTAEQKEFLTSEDVCWKCGGELDTGFECIDCKEDCIEHMRKIVQDKSKKKAD